MNKIYIPLVISFLFACAHLKQAQQFHNEGNYDQAIAVSLAAIQKDSTDTKAYYILAQSYRARGDLDSAETAIENALHFNPESEQYQSMMGEIWVEKGDQRFKNGDFTKAIADYENALAIPFNVATVTEKIGDAHYKAGRHDSAERAYLSALAFGGDTTRIRVKVTEIDSLHQQSDLLNSSGLSALDKDQYDQAKELFGKALGLKPDHLDAKYNLRVATGLRLYKKGSKSALWDSIVEFGHAAALKPKSGRPHYLMARAYEKKDRKEFDNAIREYELAAELEPGSELAQKSLNRAKLLRARQKKLKDFWGR